MRITCGWAEFIHPAGREAVARGSVSARVNPGSGRGYWEGEVRLLRGYEQLLDGTGSLWLLRFDHGREHRWIELRALEQVWAPSGLRATAHILSYDREVPPVVRELGGE